jgi:SAM-dependent methyltransferase
MTTRKILEIIANKFFDTSKHNSVKKFHETKDKKYLKELYSSDEYLSQYSSPKKEWINKFKMLIKFMRIKKGETVLDIGCTTKMLKPFVEKAKGKYFSFDVSDKFKPSFVGDAEDMHMIKDNQFDWVVAADIIEHIPNPTKALKEISRISKKSIITVPNWYHFDNISILPSNPYDRHLTKQNPFKWIKMCKKAGFTVRKISGLNYTLDIPTYNIKILVCLNKFLNNILFQKFSKFMNKNLADSIIFKYLGQTLILVLKKKDVQ